MFLNRVVLAVFCLLSLAAPAGAQESGALRDSLPVAHDGSGALTGGSAGLLFAPACLSCTRISTFAAADVEGGRLPRGVAPVIGGVVGAVVGLVVVRVYCADHFCEMGDLFGPLIGGLVGYMIGEMIDGTFPGQAPLRR